MFGQPHSQTQDADNLAKSLMDGLAPGDDARFHDIRVIKRWGGRGRVVLLKYPVTVDEMMIRHWLLDHP